MTWHVFEPRDPLMVRDGRPFGVDTEGARSLDFPPPSVIAGALRTRVGLTDGKGTFQLTPDQAREIETCGPLLAELGDKGVTEVFFAAPKDAVVFKDNSAGWQRYPLTPAATRWTDGDASLHDGLLPVVGACPLPRDKPAADAPAYWSRSVLRSWLDAAPTCATPIDRAQTRPGLEHEARVHLALDPESGTGVDGKLFQTDGLRFELRVGNTVRRFGLLVRCADKRLPAGLVPLGGERRLSAFAPATGFEPRWDPPSLREGRARVVLLTPGIFSAGALPDTILGARVHAVAVGRPQALSGWDLAAGGAKAVRRLAPAGTVYWVALPSGIDPTKWARDVHFTCISDQKQDRRDGFGLAAVGVWA